MLRKRDAVYIFAEFVESDQAGAAHLVVTYRRLALLGSDAELGWGEASPCLGVVR